MISDALIYYFGPTFRTQNSHLPQKGGGRKNKGGKKEKQRGKGGKQQAAWDRVASLPFPFFFFLLFPVTCVGETRAGDTTVGEVVLLCPWASGRR